MRGYLATESASHHGTMDSRRAWRLSLTLALLMVWAAPAQAQPVVTSLAGCGRITKSGIYNLDSPSVTSSGSGDCITIAAANVMLNLNGSTITGSASGAGLHVTGSNAFIEGRGATISNFADGIEIDGAKAALENFIVTGNSDAGLYLKSATQASISNFSADTNANDGVRISKGSYNTIVGKVRATNNGRYGVWLLSTTHNNVGGFFVEDNAIAGVYTGCSGDGPLGAPCKPAVPASKSNAIFDGSVQASTDGAQTYGVIIDTGNDSNRVTNISSPSPYEKFDLDDENFECAHNAWLGNGVIFSLTPTDCIH